MSVTPSIGQFFGLDPSFLGMPAAGTSFFNQTLFGASGQLVPIDFHRFGPYLGIPPILGGTQTFTGFPTTQFNTATPTPSIGSPFSGSGAFGGGFQFGSAFGAMPLPQGVASIGSNGQPTANGQALFLGTGATPGVNPGIAQNSLSAGGGIPMGNLGFNGFF